MSTIHSTREDVMNYEIIPALGADAGDFDLDKIFDSCFEYSAELGGFVQTVDTEGFWDAAQAAAK
jgi:hypothetical protein